MFKCIICLQDLEDSFQSIEHIFPESIGGTIVLNDMCKQCNSHIGEHIDSPLVNNWFIESKRLLLKIPGKKGSIPNPLENGTFSSDPDQKVKYRMKNGKPESVYVVPKISKGKDDQGGDIVSIRLDKTDEDKISEIIKKLEKRSKKKGTPIKIDKIERVEERIEQPSIKISLKLDLYDWQPGLIKIAFELVYRKFGIFYLSDPIAQRIIELLRKKEPKVGDIEATKINGEIFIRDAEIVPFLNNPDCLYALFVPWRSKLVCTIMIFNTFICRIVMTEKLETYVPCNWDLIIIDAKKKQTIETTYQKYVISVSGENSSQDV